MKNMKSHLLHNKTIVLYDVSVLGFAQINNLARTGIFTYVLNLASQLNSLNDEVLLLPVSCHHHAVGLLHSLQACRTLGLSDALIVKQLGPLGWILFRATRKDFNANLFSFAPLLEFIDSFLGGKKNIITRCVRSLIHRIVFFLRSLFDMYINARTRALIKEMSLISRYGNLVVHFPHKINRSLRLRGDAAPNVKFVVTVHDLIPVLFPEFFPDGAGTDFLQFLQDTSICDAVLAVSAVTKDDYVAFKGIAKAPQVFVTPLSGEHTMSSTDSDRSSATDVQSILGKYNLVVRDYFLFVGTIEPRKNLQRLLKAFSLGDNPLRNRISLVVVGAQGWEKCDIRNLVEELGIAQRVVFTGFIEDFELSVLYSNATAFVYPSLYEGFGLPVLEAMSYGIPVVTSKGTSMAEIALDAAIYIDPLSIESISEGLDSVLSLNKHQWNVLANASLVRSRSFNWETTAKLTLNAYQEVLKST